MTSIYNSIVYILQSSPVFSHFSSFNHISVIIRSSLTRRAEAKEKKNYEYQFRYCPNKILKETVEITGWRFHISMHAFL